MKIAVIGTGTMGHGITQVFAMNGHEVVFVGRSESSLDNALQKIKKSLERFSKKRDTNVKEVMSNISTSTDTSDCKDADLVIEAIVEDIDRKKELFKKLDQECDRDTIFASNTSSIPISKLSDCTKRPEKFIGMHFFNPVQMMDLVEIIVGEKTSDKVREEITMLVQSMGKEPITVMDSPAFVTSRLIMIMINEAIYCLYEKIASKEDIDKAMKLGMNHPMGPLELADLVGLDVVFAILNSMYKNFKSEKYRPCPLLVKKIKNNELGRKTQRGFYDYNS